MLYEVITARLVDLSGLLVGDVFVHVDEYVAGDGMRYALEGIAAAAFQALPTAADQIAGAA